MNNPLSIWRAGYYLPVFLFLTICCTGIPQKHKTIGWNILSDNESQAHNTLQRARSYGVNHLQLSHKIVHDLKDVKDDSRRALANRLTTAAHEAGIKDVLLWDHAFYDAGYYPNSYKLPDGRIDLDNSGFWEWFKSDYRTMLDMVPDIDGIVLTFIETGARVEEQFSEKLPSPQQKLAALVDTIAHVLIDERGLQLYIRTFIYNRQELQSLLSCIELIQHPGIKVMVKEAPHDFFITHPVSGWVSDIKYPVIIEFDCAHEYNGQGVIASIFPKVHGERWKYYRQLPNVEGFSIRTDRYGTNNILQGPSEINLFTLHSLLETPEITYEEIFKDFISQKYGTKASPFIQKAFEKAPEVITSSLYTLGLNTARHSKIDFRYRSIYTRSVSGRWMEEPIISIGHGIDTSLHYWKDISNHLSPSLHKLSSPMNLKEIPDVLENGWFDEGDLMNEAYLDMVLAEKFHAVRLAEEAMLSVEMGEAFISDKVAFQSLYQTFNRTLLTAKLHLIVAHIYYGSRVYINGERKNQQLFRELQSAVENFNALAPSISWYSYDYPKGGYDWKADIQRAKEIIEETGLFSIP